MLLGAVTGAGVGEGNTAPSASWLNFLSSQNASPLSVLLRIAIILAVTFLVVRICRWFWKQYTKAKEIKIQHKFFYNIVIIIIYIIGFLLAITRIEGVKKALPTLIASSGFIALAIGLAAQESLGNFINGIMVTLFKPFEVGDRIRLVEGNITGYVEDITLRHTVMRTFVNSRIIIPNSTMNKNMIENSNYQVAQASSFVDVIITHDSDVELARRLMGDIIGEHPLFLDRRDPLEQETTPKVNVFLRDITIYGSELRASMWTADINDNFGACSDARYAIKKAFEEQGILLSQTPARPELYARAGAIPSESGNYKIPLKSYSIPLTTPKEQDPQ